MKNTNKQVKIEIVFLSLFLLATSIIGFTANGINKEYKDIDTATYHARMTKFDQIKGIAVIKATTTMDRAFEIASKEFNVPVGLIKGIANAESGLGKYFAHKYDYNCNNFWGLKGGNMTKRKDGSYLRCFTSLEAGARTMAKTLRAYYLDEGRTTPEKIAPKWIGSKFCNVKQSNGLTHCQNWVKNVNKFVKT